jgi:thiosulfate dehydrogenase [quinone] large subunit
MTTEKTSQVAERLVTKYGMRVSKEVAQSVFMDQPKVPVLLSRASFRSDVDVRTEQRTRFQRERRQALHTMLGLAGVSIIGLLLFKTASTPALSQPIPTTYVQSAVTHSAQLLANASNVPPDQALTFNDPALGPIVLIHLDNGKFVAYSTICTHAGCQVQFNPSAKDLECPCHGAVYDPYNNAQVVAGPAPYPLQSIPIQYDQSTGNIYLAT